MAQALNGAERGRGTGAGQGVASICGTHLRRCSAVEWMSEAWARGRKRRVDGNGAACTAGGVLRTQLPQLTAASLPRPQGGTTHPAAAHGSATAAGSTREVARMLQQPQTRAPSLCGSPPAQAPAAPGPRARCGALGQVGGRVNDRRVPDHSTRRKELVPLPPAPFLLSLTWRADGAWTRQQRRQGAGRQSRSCEITWRCRPSAGKPAELEFFSRETIQSAFARVVSQT